MAGKSVIDNLLMFSFKYHFRVNVPGFLIARWDACWVYRSIITVKERVSPITIHQIRSMIYHIISCRVISWHTISLNHTISVHIISYLTCIDILVCSLISIDIGHSPPQALQARPIQPRSAWTFGHLHASS